MKKTILLADDDPSVRENLARVLELDDYHVVRASGGAEATEKMLSARPDLALFDLDLSDQKDWPGLDVLCDANHNLPIVLITARSHQYKRAMQLGVDALMEKPLHFPLLLKTIRNLVREPDGERLRRLIDPDFKTLFLNQPVQIAPALSDEQPEQAAFLDPA